MLRRCRGVAVDLRQPGAPRAARHPDPVGRHLYALAKFGPSEIFNTDQGSQFTSDEWTTPLKRAGVAISMDGKGRWIDNVFIERLWRSVKCEEVYLRAYASGSEARQCLARYFAFYNARRVHESLGYATPDEANFDAAGTRAAA